MRTSVPNSATFGSFAGIIIIMLYIYYASFIMLVGAEMTRLIEEHAPKANEGERPSIPSNSHVTEREGLPTYMRCCQALHATSGFRQIPLEGP